MRGKPYIERDYKDILEQPYPAAILSHPRMDTEKRAARFAPFDALTGYGDKVREMARYTEERPELSEDQKAELDFVLQTCMEQYPGGGALVCVKYFRPDARKKGGEVCTVEDTLKNIVLYRRLLILKNGTKIPLEDILELKCLGKVKPDEE